MLPDETTRGPAAASRIPPASVEQVDAEYCLWFLRQVRDCVFATVDADGLPSARVIDVMHVEDGRLYFLTARGKAFYSELMHKPYVAIVGMTADFRMVRLEGRVERPGDKTMQKRLVDWMFRLNPEMEKLYDGDSRYVLEVFYIERGHGEYYDLGQNPVVRVPYEIGGGGFDPLIGRFVVTDACTECDMCARVCPQQCISGKSDGRYVIEQSACLGCGLCSEKCPTGAIKKRGRDDESR